MKDKIVHTRGWFLKAESDLADARRTVASEGPYREHICPSADVER